MSKCTFKECIDVWILFEPVKATDQWLWIREENWKGYHIWVDMNLFLWIFPLLFPFLSFSLTLFMSLLTSEKPLKSGKCEFCFLHIYGKQCHWPWLLLLSERVQGGIDWIKLVQIVHPAISILKALIQNDILRGKCQQIYPYTNILWQPYLQLSSVHLYSNRGAHSHIVICAKKPYNMVHG